jgi:hypothetical protein
MVETCRMLQPVFYRLSKLATAGDTFQTGSHPQNINVLPFQRRRANQGLHRQSQTITAHGVFTATMPRGRRPCCVRTISICRLDNGPPSNSPYRTTAACAHSIPTTVFCWRASLTRWDQIGIQRLVVELDELLYQIIQPVSTQTGNFGRNAK